MQNSCKRQMLRWANKESRIEFHYKKIHQTEQLVPAFDVTQSKVDEKQSLCWWLHVHRENNQNHMNKETFSFDSGFDFADFADIWIEIKSLEARNSVWTFRHIWVNSFPHIFIILLSPFLLKQDSWIKWWTTDDESRDLNGRKLQQIFYNCISLCLLFPQLLKNIKQFIQLEISSLPI